MKLKKEFINNGIKNNILLLGNITLDSFTCFFNNTFIVFKTIDNCHYLVYTSKNYSIICFDLYHKKRIAEIKKINKELITSFRHYIDEISKKDLVLTISSMNNNLRIWDVKNWQCFLYINKVYNEGVLYSACLLNDKKYKYLVTSNCNYFGDSELIKIFNLEGNKIKEINESNDATLLIDIFYDKKHSKKYIITGNKNYLKSFDYEKSVLYHKYYECYNGAHFSFIVDDKEEIIKLIDSCEDGHIRIWNFDTNILLNKIQISKYSLYDICFLNDNYLLIGCQDKTITLFDLSINKIINILKGHNNYVITIKKIKHNYYGECIISHGFENDQIKIWKIKK